MCVDRIIIASCRLTSSRDAVKKLYDDYIELEPGALQALEEYLNSPVYRRRPAHESEQGHTLSHSIPFNSKLASTRNPDSTAISGQAYDAPGQNIRSNQVREDVELGEISPRSSHLLLCMENGRHGVQLHQELITHIIDDRQLFHTLRSVYHSHRGRFKPYLSLRIVCRIDIMKVCMSIPKLMRITIDFFLMSR